MNQNCEVRIDVYDQTPNPVETINVIEMMSPSIVKLPEGVSFQQLVDQKKIVLKESFLEIEQGACRNNQRGAAAKACPGDDPYSKYPDHQKRR
jgi:hypothetical protein